MEEKKLVRICKDNGLQYEAIPSGKGKTLKIGIVIFPDVEELDFVGPWEIVSMWGVHAQGPEQRFIVAQSTEPVICAKGMTVVPDVDFTQCPSLDILVVPGGQGTRKEIDNASLISFISMQASNCKAVLSVCTGSFLLHRAGLLKGKRVTTHWNSLDRLKAFEDVTVVEERFVKDGNIWSSAGVSAGIDMMLSFIASFSGEEAAAKTQAAAEYYPSATIYGNFHKHPKAPRYLK
jgi:transcriptional regulator GlxA family with amidase domain